MQIRWTDLPWKSGAAAQIARAEHLAHRCSSQTSKEVSLQRRCGKGASGQTDICNIGCSTLQNRQWQRHQSTSMRPGTMLMCWNFSEWLKPPLSFHSRT